MTEAPLSTHALRSRWKPTKERLQAISTYNSYLNHQSLSHCIAMLRHLLNTLLLVMIDHGADEDWGAMCYPPLDSTPARK